MVVGLTQKLQLATPLVFSYYWINLKEMESRCSDYFFARSNSSLDHLNKSSRYSMMRVWDHLTQTSSTPSYSLVSISVILIRCGSAPYPISTFTTSKCPWRHATYMGLIPNEFSRFIMCLGFHVSYMCLFGFVFKIFFILSQSFALPREMAAKNY